MQIRVILPFRQTGCRSCTEKGPIAGPYSTKQRQCMSFSFEMVVAHLHVLMLTPSHLTALAQEPRQPLGLPRGPSTTAPAPCVNDPEGDVLPLRVFLRWCIP